jgi:hypothetical protein
MAIGLFCISLASPDHLKATQSFKNGSGYFEVGAGEIVDYTDSELKKKVFLTRLVADESVQKESIHKLAHLHMIETCKDFGKKWVKLSSFQTSYDKAENKILVTSKYKCVDHTSRSDSEELKFEKLSIEAGCDISSKSRLCNQK